MEEQSPQARPVASATQRGLTAREHEILGEIERRRDDVGALAADLIGFDTSARADTDDPARGEAALQEYLADRVRAAGAETDPWEPTPEEVAGSP